MSHFPHFTLCMTWCGMQRYYSKQRDKYQSQIILGQEKSLPLQSSSSSLLSRLEGCSTQGSVHSCSPEIWLGIVWIEHHHSLHRLQRWMPFPSPAKLHLFKDKRGKGMGACSVCSVPFNGCSWWSNVSVRCQRWRDHERSLQLVKSGSWYKGEVQTHFTLRERRLRKVAGE